MRKNITKTSRFKALCATGCALIMGAIAMVAPTGNTYALNSFGTEGKAYTDYDTLEEAQAAAADLNVQIVGEGTVLLKNKDNALPMEKNSYVSVFGVASDGIEGKLLTDALREEGFQVNSRLEQLYAADSSDDEVTEFSTAIRNSFGSYDDAAIIVLARSGGEARDGGGATTIDEISDDAEELATGGWEHAALGEDDDGNELKHSMMLTDAERDLLAYVKTQGFKKIVYLVCSAMPMEVKILEDDDAVDGMLWIGTPGENGMTAVARVLNGDINPSGKTSDTWYTDATADPTWYNLQNNNHLGSSATYGYLDDDGEFVQSSYRGLELEEGIYRGYRYYETRAYEMNKADAGSGNEWYETAMTYPFGYGLSYTTFEYSEFSVNLPDGTSIQNATGLEGLFASKVGETADVKTLTAKVTVTNTGTIAGKESVQIYSSAPYDAVTAPVEKSHVTLVGFEKTKLLQPGESQTLEITFNVQDMASYDAYGIADGVEGGETGYVLEGGAWSIYALENSHGWAQSSALRVNFSLDSDTYLHLDDWSDNEIYNLYSDENGMNYTLRVNGGEHADTHYDYNEDTSANMTQLSRGDMGASTIDRIDSFPEAPTRDDLTLTMDFLDALTYWDNFRIGDEVKNYLGNGTGVIYKDGQTIRSDTGTIVNGDMDFPWNDAIDTQRMQNWTQAETALTGTRTAEILVEDLAGIDPYGSDLTEFTDENGNRLTESEVWDLFMNQLTWTEVESIVSVWQKNELSSVGYYAYKGTDQSINVASTYLWSTNALLAATFNTELAEKQGELCGNFALLSNCNLWWGPGSQTHRSWFDGRSSEYFSDDPFLAGSMSAAESYGATSKGVVTCTKHFTLYSDSPSADGVAGGSSSISRGTGSLMFISEQALREIEIKPFQMTAQEGNAGGIMGSFNRIGSVASVSSWNTTTALFRQQFGRTDLTWTTDIYFAVSSYSPIDLMTRIGGDNFDQSTHITGTWDADSNAVMVPTGDNGDLEASAATWYTTRMNAMRIIAQHANSAMNNNGVYLIDWSLETGILTATQGIQLSNVSVAVSDENIEGAAEVTYAVTSGALPGGVSINNDGTLTGIPTEAGTFSFTVTVTADGWITAQKQFTMTVASGFITEDMTGEVGDEFFGAVYSELSLLEDATYSIAEGTLPDGITLDPNGAFTGTPTEAGTFEIVINASVTTTSGSWWSSTTSTTVYTINATITITGETVDPIAELQQAITNLQITVDGLEDTDLSEINAAIDVLETTVAGLTNYDDTDVREAIDTLKSVVSELTNYDDTAIQSAIDDLERAVAALEASGDTPVEGDGCSGSFASTGIMAAAAFVLVVTVMVIARKRRNSK